MSWNNREDDFTTYEDEPSSSSSFRTYFDDINSSTSVCRSISLLIPTAADAGTNDATHVSGSDAPDPRAVLNALREWRWLCGSVLVRPWRKKTKEGRIETTSGEKSERETEIKCCPDETRSGDEGDDLDEYRTCLPSEDELEFLHRKSTSPSSSPLPNSKMSQSAPALGADGDTAKSRATDRKVCDGLGGGEKGAKRRRSDCEGSPQPLRTALARRHLRRKSLIVPLTDGGAAFVLHALFALPWADSDRRCTEWTSHTAEDDAYYESEAVDGMMSDERDRGRVRMIQRWVRCMGIIPVHNSDGNQTVSLTKEVDSFPKMCHPEKKNTAAALSPPPSFTFVDLFAGIGGFRLGMEALEGKCVGCCEVDAHARDTYRRNFSSKVRVGGAGNRNNRGYQSTDERAEKSSAVNGGVANYDDDDVGEFYVTDIARLEVPPGYADVICGGFPCQSFSTLAGKHQRHHQESESRASEQGRCVDLDQNEKRGGLDTPDKGRLFFHILRIIRKAKPKLFVLENVKGLLGLDGGSHVKRILDLLSESGYEVTYGVVDASWFLPQRRERVFFVGVRRDMLGADEIAKGLLGKDDDPPPLVSPPFVAFVPKELRLKYQIYGNEIVANGHCDVNMSRTGSNSAGAPSKSIAPRTGPPPSLLASVLETDDATIHSGCYLTSRQWERVRCQSYVQVHADGTGQLLTGHESCAQTLVSSYQRSYLMHSQFIVPSDSVYLPRQRSILCSVGRRVGNRSKKSVTDENGGFDENSQRDCADADASQLISDKERTCDRAAGGYSLNAELPSLFDEDENENKILADETLPRFFTLRECCRLQGFPESFVIPDGNAAVQFYRQIGNAVVPACVVAVVKDVVQRFFSINADAPNHALRVEKKIRCPLFNLVARASPNPELIWAAVERKHHTMQM